MEKLNGYLVYRFQGNEVEKEKLQILLLQDVQMQKTRKHGFVHQTSMREAALVAYAQRLRLCLTVFQFQLKSSVDVFLWGALTEACANARMKYFYS